VVKLIAAFVEQINRRPSKLPTDVSVASIKEVGATIARTLEISATVAAAVEQQCASVQQVAQRAAGATTGWSPTPTMAAGLMRKAQRRRLWAQNSGCPRSRVYQGFIELHQNRMRESEPSPLTDSTGIAPPCRAPRASRADPAAPASS
jgi:hypothetical protein